MTSLRRTSLAERGRRIANEIVANPKNRKHFDRLMKEGKDWIGDLTEQHGPFSGYELHEFLYWYKKALKHLPKNKNIPEAVDPKPKPLEKLEITEGMINPEGSVRLNKAPPQKYEPSAVEKTTNAMCVQEGDIKFTFKAKQRYIDVTNLLKKTNGMAPDFDILNLPEREPEEIAKPPPISVPEKYEAFLLEEVLLPPELPKENKNEKPEFVTSFWLPDATTRKMIVAKEKSGKTGFDEYIDVSKHKFREEYNPKDLGLPDFVLRLPKPELARLELDKDSAETETKNKKQMIKEKEEAEKMRRTKIGSVERPEWVHRFKPIPLSVEIGTQQAHKLLPKGEYSEPIIALSRDEDFRSTS